MNELLDQQIPLSEVIASDDSIIELLASRKSFNERIEQFEKYLQRIRFDLGKDQKMVQYTWNNY